MHPEISGHVDGGPSRGSSVCRPSNKARARAEILNCLSDFGLIACSSVFKALVFQHNSFVSWYVAVTDKECLHIIYPFIPQHFSLSTVYLSDVTSIGLEIELYLIVLS